MSIDPTSMIQVDDDEPVGYGNTPKHTRFKPGQSGNPKGRPRIEFEDIDVQHLFIEELHKLVTVNTKRGPKKMPAWKVIAQRLLADCMKGNPQAIKLYREFTNDFHLISDAKKRKKEDDKPRLRDYLRQLVDTWDEKRSAKSQRVRSRN